jgi:predicted MFS family arabinose efflux permease
LLGARLALGVVVALGGPAVASLTGDLFPSVERSRVLGLILTGELIGAGAGLLLATDVGSLVGWRATFVVLAVPSALLAWALARFPEPARHRSPPIATSSPERIPLRRRVRECEDVEPEADRVNEPVEALSTRHAFAYVLRIRSNLVLIACSTLGYFFLSGLRTFAVVFARGHYGLGAGEVSVLMVVIGGAAAAGTLIGGRVTDRLIGRGHLDARMIVPGVAFVLVVAALVPGILTTSVVVALPLLAVAGSLLGAPNPALDAARLDVTPGLLRGRAEAVRTTFRGLFESFAPLLFGLVADLFGASGDSRAVGSGTSNLALSPASVHGLELTFLVMTIPLALSGVLLLWQRRTYLTDVATADAAEERARATAEGGEGTRPPVPLGRVAERR